LREYLKDVIVQPQYKAQIRFPWPIAQPLKKKRELVESLEDLKILVNVRADVPHCKLKYENSSHAYFFNYVVYIFEAIYFRWRTKPMKFYFIMRAIQYCFELNPYSVHLTLHS